MGNPKLKWTAEEEEALRAGVAKHGQGKWKNIQRDPEFHQFLHARSNIDLKDKWRNLSVAGGNLAPREKSRAITKLQPDIVETTVTPLPSVPKPLVAASSHVTKRNAGVIDSSKASADKKDSARLNEMIIEAISILNRPNGSDFAAISNYIEQQMHELPLNFKRTLSGRLGRLAQQGKLEKVQKCYRIKNDVQTDARTAMNQKEIHHTMNQKEIHHRPLNQVQSMMHVEDNTAEAAAVSAAYRIADAENKSFVAAEAMKEAEKVSSMAEEMDSLLQFAIYCFEQSAQGDFLLMV